MKGHEIEHVCLRKLYGPLHLRVMSTTFHDRLSSLMVEIRSRIKFPWESSVMLAVHSSCNHQETTGLSRNGHQVSGGSTWNYWPNDNCFHMFSLLILISLRLARAMKSPWNLHFYMVFHQVWYSTIELSQVVAIRSREERAHCGATHEGPQTLH